MAPEQNERETLHGLSANVLMLVDSWSSGGRENLIVDLSQCLVASGLSVFVATASGPPPPASAFGANSRISTISFKGDEVAFDAFLRQRSVDLVNYHDTFFAIDVLRRQSITGVFTLHSCYLWMDDQSR